jgi:ABC-type lipoprotein export system ATPase subunit
MSSAEAIVCLDSVTRSFGAGERTVTPLRAVDLVVRPGAFVAVAGPSGSGKTTLLNLAGALDDPSAGAVTLLGRRLDRCVGAEREALRRRVGYVFQSAALLASSTAAENVELALRLSAQLPQAQWAGRVRRSLAAVGLDPWRDHRVFELSGGQQQRVALARALAIRPQLLLADEPTGDLDQTTARQVCELLRALCAQEGMAVLVATHDPLVESFATERYALAGGVLGLVSASSLEPEATGDTPAPSSR